MKRLLKGKTNEEVERMLKEHLAFKAKYPDIARTKTLVAYEAELRAERAARISKKRS